MKISKADYETLPEGMKAAFNIIDGTEEYSNNEEDAGALKNALESEKAAKKKAAKERDELKSSNDLKTQEAIEEALKEAREKGDFAAIEKDYQAKLAAAEEKINLATERANSQLVENAQGKIIDDLGKVFVAPTAMSSYLKSRLKTQVAEDGSVTTRVLDQSGNPTAASIDDLKKEIIDNSEFKAILAAGKGSGGGATGSKAGGESTVKKLSEMDADETLAFKREQPEQYAAQQID